MVLSPVRLTHRSPDRFAVALSPLHGDACDEGEIAGDRPVRTPDFFAVDGEMAAGRVQHRFRSDVRGIGSGERFGQREGGDVLPRHARQIFGFLCVVSEEQDGDRDADGLGHCDRERQNIAPTGHHGQHPTVVLIGEPQAPVLFRDLHPEGPEVEQPLEDLGWNLRRALDLVRIDLAPEKGLHFLAIGFARLPLFGRLVRWTEQIKIGPALEQPRHEARPGDALAGFLDPLHSLQEGRHPITSLPQL